MRGGRPDALLEPVHALCVKLGGADRVRLQRTRRVAFDCACGAQLRRERRGEGHVGVQSYQLERRWTPTWCVVPVGDHIGRWGGADWGVAVVTLKRWKLMLPPNREESRTSPTQWVPAWMHSSAFANSSL